MAPAGCHQNFPRALKGGVSRRLQRLLLAQEISMDVISNFAARFERSREEELSIEEIGRAHV